MGLSFTLFVKVRVSPELLSIDLNKRLMRRLSRRLCSISLIFRATGDKFLGNANTGGLSCTPLANSTYSCPDSLIGNMQTAISNQNFGGYTYVYMLEQGDWNAKTIYSFPTGVYSGQSLYQLDLGWMVKYN